MVYEFLISKILQVNNIYIYFWSSLFLIKVIVFQENSKSFLVCIECIIILWVRKISICLINFFFFSFVENYSSRVESEQSFLMSLLDGCL